MAEAEDNNLPSLDDFLVEEDLPSVEDYIEKEEEELEEQTQTIENADRDWETFIFSFRH